MSYEYRVVVPLSEGSYKEIRAGSRPQVFHQVNELVNTSRISIGTEIRIDKVYRAKRGYEPGKPASGSTVASYRYRLAALGSFYDPKTGRPKPPHWVTTR